MMWLDVFLLAPITVVVYVVLRRVESPRRIKVALWLAFYFTVPFVLYDWLYCGMYLGHGGAFFFHFWYLTVYYVVPWVLIPAVAMHVNRLSPATEAPGALTP
jgi:hypothetical protein